MSVLSSISGIFDGRLNAMANLPDVAWPNSAYQPVEGTLFLTPILLIGNVSLSDLDYSEEIRGVYQIMVSSPAGEYKAEAEQAVDNLVDHFNSTRRLSLNGYTVNISNVSWDNAFTEGAWYQIPVSVNYKVYVDR